MPDRSRMGVSPIIATLLLIVIAVAGAVVTYAFVSGFMGSTPEAPEASISVDSVTGNDTHVMIYVRNSGTGEARVDYIYVEKGGNTLASHDVDAVIPPSNVGVVEIGKGSLGSDTTYTFKIVCTGSTMPTVYSSSISGAAPLPTDTTPPAVSFIAGTEGDRRVLGRYYACANLSFSDPNLDGATINIYNATHLVATQTYAASPGFLNASGLPVGIYYINATAQDTYGNTASTETRKVMVDPAVRAAYFFEEGSGTTVYDCSENGNDGTMRGNVTWAAGADGTGILVWNSSNVTIPNSTSLNIAGNQITLEAWVKWDVNLTAYANSSALFRYSSIISKGGLNYGYKLMHNQYVTRFQFGARINGSWSARAGTSQPLQGVWYHVAGVYNGTHLITYVNGVRQGTPTARTGNLTTNTNSLIIGCLSATQGQFVGYIDSVLIYDRPLSQSEITDHANGLW